VNSVLNVSAYKFVVLQGLPALRDALAHQAAAAALRGTILLAGEGINLFLAGAPPAVRGFLQQLREDPRLADLQARESWSDSVPFRRLRVKVKREIIRMNQPAIQPARGRAPVVDAATLARWLDAGRDDAGRPVVMLDTRNAFEVDHGRFAGALDWRLARFSDFPAAARHHLPQLAGHTVVSYCTGGIRCEKAALLLGELGVRAYQLDGGILRYLEAQPAGPHWQGHCFVFDAREALDGDLAPAERTAAALEATPGRRRCP
jgi:UPF0176 protein